MTLTSNSPGVYAVSASIARTVNGWTSVMHSPTFFLHADVQGITSQAGAEKIAHRMVAEMAGPGASVAVVVVDVTGDYAYPEDVAP